MIKFDSQTVELCFGGGWWGGSSLNFRVKGENLIQIYSKQHQGKMLMSFVKWKN